MKIETFDLERWMTTYELDARYDLAESGIAPPTLGELLALDPAGATLERLLAMPLGYSEARGTAALRAAIAALYDDTTPEQILVTTGAIEANFLLCNVLLEPGDTAIAVYPAYQQLYAVPAACGATVKRWELREEEGWRFDLAALERLLDDRTRLIVVNTPHNPTGATMPPADFRRLHALCEERGIWLLSDEAYRWLTFSGEEPAPPARSLGGRGISVGTLSKPLGLPGLRVGWLAAPEEIVRRCCAMRDYVSLSPGKLNDALALLALGHRDRLLERTRAIATENFAALHDFMEDHAGVLSWVPPRGGLLALVRYALDLPSYQFANRLAEERGVMLAPGAAFGQEHHFRIGFGPRPEVFREGLAVVADYLRELGG
jgi:aspartate/methionine/tyrosine aminotransferase